MNTAIDELRREHPDLPQSLFAFIARNAGLEAELSTAPGWVQVWSAEEAATLTGEYGLPDFLPSYLAFASNGGGELFVIALTGDDERPVFMVPAADLSANAIVQVAESLGAFERAIVRRT